MFEVSEKKQLEQIWSKVFVSKINEEQGFDYEVVVEPEEMSPIDVMAISKSGKFPQLKLQLTFAIETPFIAYPPMASDYTKVPTQRAIDKKIEKYGNQQVDMSDIILLVQGYMSSKAVKFSFADSSFKEYAHYPFKGIYYVSPPMFSGETNEQLQGGVLVTIKDAFEN